MALNSGALERARSLLGLKPVNDLNGKNKDGEEEEKKKKEDIKILKSPISTAFDNHEKMMSKTEVLRTTSLKGSLAPSVRARILDRLSSSSPSTTTKKTRAPRKRTESKADERKRLKHTTIDLKSSGDELDDDEDPGDDEFDEDDPFFAQDDEIEYDSNVEEEEEDDDNDDDSEVSTSREETSEDEENSDDDDDDGNNTEELEDELYQQDELHQDEDEAVDDECNKNTIARQAIRRWFQLLDCSVTSKFKDMFMALTDSLLYEDDVRFDTSTIKYTDAMVSACRLYKEGVTKPSGKLSISACFLWLHAKTQLMFNIINNDEYSGNTELVSWIRCIADDSYADDIPMSATTRRLSQTCFYTKKPCNTGFTIVHCITKKPLTTLWYCNDDEYVYSWVHMLIRFLFLPAYIRRWCETNFITLATDDDRNKIIEFAIQSTDMFSQFLWDHDFKKANHKSIQWPEIVRRK